MQFWNGYMNVKIFSNGYNKEKNQIYSKNQILIVYNNLSENYIKMKKLINLKFFSVLLLRDEQVEVNGIKFIEP